MFQRTVNSIMSRTVFIYLIVIVSLLIIVCNCAVSNSKPYEEYFMEHEVSEKEAKQEFREIKEKIFKGEVCCTLLIC